jgi:multiple sugar transport system permease protein
VFARLGRGRSAGQSAARQSDSGEATLGWLFVTPAALFICVFLVAPLALAVAMAFMRIDLTRSADWTFFGLGNFKQLADDELVLPAAIRTAQFGLIVVGLTTFSALSVALLLNERFRGVRIVRVIVLLPWAIAPLVAGVTWQLVFHITYGALNAVLLWLGVIHTPVGWLSDPGLAYVAIVVGQVWLAVPFASLILLARLQGLPAWLYRAAEMDGAGRWARFRFITLPLLRSTLLIVVLIEMIISFQTFDLVYALTSGGPAGSTQVISMLIYNRTFADLRIGYGAALAVLLGLVVGGVSLIFVALARSRRGAPA